MITKKEFEEKYLEERKQISREYGMDMGVATDILIAHVRNKNYTDEELKEMNPYIASPNELRYNFDGCQNLNYEELEAEIAEFDKIAAEKRKELGL